MFILFVLSLAAIAGLLILAWTTTDEEREFLEACRRWRGGRLQ